MAQRIDRSVPDSIRKKISDSMKRYHQGRTEEEKRQTNAKRSAAAKEYWRQIPPKSQVTMDDLVL